MTLNKEKDNASPRSSLLKKNDPSIYEPSVEKESNAHKQKKWTLSKFANIVRVKILKKTSALQSDDGNFSSPKPLGGLLVIKP